MYNLWLWSYDDNNYILYHRGSFEEIGKLKDGVWHLWYKRYMIENGDMKLQEPEFEITGW